MKRLALVPLLLLGTLACEEDDDEAIEITGYLDTDAISYTAVEPINEAYEVRATVFGPPGSVGAGQVLVTNERTGEQTVVTATDRRSFAAELTLLQGDTVRVTQRLRNTSLPIEGQSPFPDAEVDRFSDSVDALVLVKGSDAYQWWVTHLETGLVEPLETVADGRLHAIYTEDGLLQVHAETREGIETRAILLHPDQQ